jgi:cell division initiation protein
MRITPLDVRKQEFRKAVRGFDCDEVRAFLSTLADEYETVLVDNKQIRELIMEQEDKINEYQGMERNLRDTLMTAERVMKETRENASKEGDLIVQDAHMKAQRVLEECRLRTEELRREIAGLRQEKENYLGRFKSLAQAQIQFVDSHESDFEDLDNRLTKIVDSVVATAGHTRRKTDSSSDPTPASTPTLDPFAAENRIEGDPSAPRDLLGGYEEAADSGEEAAGSGEDKLEVAVSAAPLENDVWRDYKPGSDKQDNEGAPGSICDLVSESLAETGSESTQQKTESPEQEDTQPTESTLDDESVMTDGEEPVPAGATKDTH